MRQTTIRQALTEAHEAYGLRDCTVTDIRVHKGTRANGGAVKLVNATVSWDGGSVRYTNLASEALRGTPKARKALQRFVGLQTDTLRDHGTGAEAIREVTHSTGPVCGRDTATGDACQRPSADGSACWQHGGDAARQGLVAKSDGNVRDYTPKPTPETPSEPKAARGLDTATLERIAAAAAKAAVEAVIEHATA